MSAPDEAAALAAVKTVQALSGPEMEKRVRATIGDPLLAMFSLLAKSTASEGDSERMIAQKVQLMIMAYLIREELTAPSPASAPKKPAK